MKNSAIDWNEFDPAAYYDVNYASARQEDLTLTRWCAEALKQLPEGARCIDVGTGSNIIPLLCMAPLAAEITVWEYGAQNIAWLERLLAEEHLPAGWMPFWHEVMERHPAGSMPENPMARLQAAIGSRLMQRSIYDLPRETFDAATMFFCAESITSVASEFREACSSFIQSVKRGGILVAAFMEKSEGYRVGELEFPAVAIEKADIQSIFTEYCIDVSTTGLPIGENPIRAGYDGMIFVKAIRK